MSQTQMYRRQLAQLQAVEATLRREANRHSDEERKALDETRRHEHSATRTSSVSSRNSNLSSADRARKRALEVNKKQAAVTAKLAQNAKDQAMTRGRIEQAEKQDRQALDRQTRRRRREELSHARQVAQLTPRPVARFIQLRPPQPEKLRVLYLTANPRLDLRTETEVRLVQQALRGAKYRDRVDVSHRPAATFQDLLDGLNDVRPHVVHFSGHSGAAALQFDRGEVMPQGGHTVEYTLLVQALAATDQPPELLVLNSCESLDGVTTILPAVPVIVGLSDEVDDAGAIVFAQQFYAAIGSGQSVGAALAQGRVAMRAAALDPEESPVPEVVTREDIDISALLLVRPTA